MLREVVAANLRYWRGRRKLSQEALADLAGVHRTYVGSVERSEKNISVDNIEKLSKALQVEALELFRRR
jgi:transcriptional regulator with XRE-family HTH domain